MVPDERKDGGGGGDPEGFSSLATIRARAKAFASGEEFAVTCAGPALLVMGDTPEPGFTPAAGSSKKPSPSGSSFLIVTLEGGSGTASAAARRYHGRVGFVAKRPGNPFPNMISLGRSTSNDIVIGLDTISKLHGYFLRESDAWFYTDYQSTNGSYINDKRVEKGEKRLLADGDRFKLGLDIVALFLAPTSLYTRARGG